MANLQLVCFQSGTIKENYACLNSQDYIKLFGKKNINDFEKEQQENYVYISEVIIPVYPNPEFAKMGCIGMCSNFRRNLKIAYGDVLNVIKINDPSTLCCSPDQQVVITIKSFLRLKQLRRLSAVSVGSQIFMQLGGMCLSPGLDYIVKIRTKHYKITVDQRVILTPETKCQIKALDERHLLKIIDTNNTNNTNNTRDPSPRKGDRTEDILKAAYAVMASTTKRINQKNRENNAIKMTISNEDDQSDEDEFFVIPPSLPDPVSLGIGGLNEQFADIFRRAFVSRTRTTKEIHAMGLKHCRGIILHGPPGTGKTLIARKIAEMLQASAPPKLVSASSLLNKYVGESESKVRDLFTDSDKDPKGFYVIIIDEIDAVFKKRGSSTSSVGDSMVNQLLTKMDGIDTNDNFLVVAMTNRLDMLDPAMLRPGRFGVQIQIGLPDAAGRLDILKIHTSKMKLDDQVDLVDLSNQTVNFSGAELEGVVRTAATWAIQESNDFKAQMAADGQSDYDGSIVLKEEHFTKALREVEPRFGRKFRRRTNDNQELIIWSQKLSDLRYEFTHIIEYSMNRPLTVVMVSGSSRSGKSTFVGEIIKSSGKVADFIRELGPRDTVGLSDYEKVNLLTETFEDAYRSATSIIVLDDLDLIAEIIGEENIINYSPKVTFNLQMLLKHQPIDCNLLVILISSKPRMLERIGLSGRSLIDHQLELPLVEKDEIDLVIGEDQDLEIDRSHSYTIGHLLQEIEFLDSK